MRKVKVKKVNWKYKILVHIPFTKEYRSVRFYAQIGVSFKTELERNRSYRRNTIKDAGTLCRRLANLGVHIQK